MLRTLIISLILSQCLIGTGQSITASVSSDSILMGNYIKLIFTVENMDGKFEAPQLTNLDLISGPNTSNSVQIINGTKTSKTTYSYYVKPTELGTITIPPAYLVAEDNSLETVPLELNVYPNPDNIIIEPESDQSSFFNFDNWGLSRISPAVPKQPKAPSKPKRKYKKI